MTNIRRLTLIPVSGDGPELFHNASLYAIASSPFSFTMDSSLSEGPEGFFSPRSHCDTSVGATFK